jgi:cytochrome d ubiquinol oxidase subunit I
LPRVGEESKVQPVELARLEFALTVVFHYLLVALTLGLVLLVAITYTRWVRTGNPVFERMTRFWGLLYVVNYAVGIGAGLAMEFQLGMNWSGLENVASSVFGAPMAVETVVAFFAESTFLALWIFGWRRIPKKIHLTLIWLVVVSAYMSAIWALIANGFLHHPVGYQDRGGVLELTSVGALLTNSNAWIAIGHIVGAAVTTGGFFMLGVSAFLQRRGRADKDFLRGSFRTGAHAACWGAILTVGIGALQLEAVVKEQPVKFAAFIGSDRSLAQYAEELRQKFGVIDMPPSGLVRYAALTMMVIGVLALIFGIWSLIAVRRDRILASRRLTWLLIPVLALPFVANVAGWVFREVGRQPYTIYQLLSTKEALTPSLTSGDLTFSLAVFVTVVAVLLAFDCWLLARIVRRGPGASAELWSAAPDDLPSDENEEQRDRAVLV